MTHVDISQHVMTVEAALERIEDRVREQLSIAGQAVARMERAYRIKAAEADQLREALDAQVADAEVVDDEPWQPPPAPPTTAGAHIIVTSILGHDIDPTEAVLIGREWYRIDGAEWPTTSYSGLPPTLISTWHPAQMDAQA